MTQRDWTGVNDSDSMTKWLAAGGSVTLDGPIAWHNPAPWTWRYRWVLRLGAVTLITGVMLICL